MFSMVNKPMNDYQRTRLRNRNKTAQCKRTKAQPQEKANTQTMRQDEETAATGSDQALHVVGRTPVAVSGVLQGERTSQRLPED